MMAIRKFTKSDLEACTELLITVYNREPGMKSGQK